MVRPANYNCGIYSLGDHGSKAREHAEADEQVATSSRNGIEKPPGVDLAPCQQAEVCGELRTRRSSSHGRGPRDSGVSGISMDVRVEDQQSSWASMHREGDRSRRVNTVAGYVGESRVEGIKRDMR